MRKLIIFLLFIVITALAIGIVAIFPSFSFATQMKIGERAVDLDAATQATVIDVPIAAGFIDEYSKIQIVIAHDGTAGYIEVLGANDGGDLTYAPTAALDAGATYVSGATVLMWLFGLLLIILLPKRRSKKKVKKLAREEALDVVEHPSKILCTSKKKR